MALIVILLCFGVGGGIIGKSKGSSFFLWFLISFCVPFIGVLTTAVYRSDRDELRRECAGCGRILMLHDAICTRCGTEQDFPEVAIAPESQSRRRVPASVDPAG